MGGHTWVSRPKSCIIGHIRGPTLLALHSSNLNHGNSVRRDPPRVTPNSYELSHVCRVALPTLRARVWLIFHYTLISVVESLVCSICDEQVHSCRSLTDSDILDIEEYKWRLKIIEHADDLRKQKKTLHHFHKQFDLESSDDTFSSPIKMFEHMIETDKLRVGETADLKKVEEVTTSFRELFYVRKREVC